MDEFEKELKVGFLEESKDLLQSAEGAFLELEKSFQDEELINQIFRLAHNLKGTSRAVGFGDVAELTHHAENLILKIKNKELEPNNTIIELLLEFNDRVNDMISGLKNDLEASFENDDLIAKLEKALNGELQEVETPAVAEDVVEEIAEPAAEAQMSLEEAERALAEMDSVGSNPELTQSAKTEDNYKLSERDSVSNESSSIDLNEDDLNEDDLNALAQFSEDLAAGDTLDAPVPNDSIEKDLDAFLDAAAPVVAKVEVTAVAEPSSPVAPKAAPPSAPAAKKAPAKAKEDESIRVSLGRIEKLNNIVGELVILQTVLDQRRFTQITDELSNKSIGQLGKLSKEIQEISMSLRMVPVKTTFQKMTRIVRDTSKALNKKVNLQIVGEETEIDKTVLEHLGDPLVHIVRNAIDHGLEVEEDRIASGKSADGLCEIKASHEGSNLVIQVRDDGKGIDPNIIRQKAIVKGVIRENNRLTDNEVIQLIFHPGFSTKEQVTEVSGRGVGMDVVKTNIEKMSGEVSVSSVVGKGSVFKIILPLTLAIIDGMVINVGESKFIVPLNQVHEFMRISAGQVDEVSGGGKLFKMRDEVLPLFSVADALGVKVDDKSKTGNDRIAVVIRASDFAYAVEVDDIVNQQQVVIKSLGAEIKARKGFMGSSILGDGSPVVIIDFIDLFAGSLKQNPAYYEHLASGKVA